MSKRKPKTKFTAPKRFFGSMFICSLLAIVLLVGYTTMNVKQEISDGVKNLLPQSTEVADIVDPSGQEQDYNMGLFTCLIIGVDTNEERDKRSAGYNSDTLMVVAVDTATFKTTIISVPRDTYAKIYRPNKQGEIVGAKYTKINAAYSYGRYYTGKKEYGCENACRAVSELLGVPITNYISFDMEAVPPLVDAIGGVDLEIDADFSQWGMPKGSMQHLDGEKAFIYIRKRKGVGTGGGDTARTLRQLRFVNAYMKKVKKMNPASVLVKNYGTINRYTNSNMSYGDLYALAQLATKSDFSGAQTYSLSGRWDGTYLQLNKEKMNQIVADTFFSGQ